MQKANQLNQSIQSHAPAAFEMLSELGRSAAFPDGVPAQAVEAADCQYNGSIGQVTDGHGGAIPLPTLGELFSGFELNSTLLYPPQLGLTPLRKAWGDRTASRESGLRLPDPMVTVALTHAISLCADLFSDSKTTILTPTPCWGNYSAVFGLRRGAQMRQWALYNEEGGLNIEGFKTGLANISGKGIVVFNFPGNPTGYSPTLEETSALIDAVSDHPGPLIVLVDDAYQGLVHEPEVLQHSIFYPLVQRLSAEKHMAVKIDGATKELGFFGGRVGFLTLGTSDEAAAALYDKAAAIARATVSSAPAPSQMAVLACVTAPDIEAQIQQLKDLLRERYQKVRLCLPLLSEAGIEVFPFNSGCFALMRLPEHLDPHAVRRNLIQEHSVGLVALSSHQALRLAYCSMSAEQIEPALSRLALSLRA